MGLIDCLGVAVGLVALMILAGLCVGLLSRWLSHKQSWTARMKFKQWVELYYLRPKDWCLEDTPNRYITGKIYGSSGWVYVQFSFLDYLRYQLWRKDTKHREIDTQRDKRLKDILELAQSDIARLKQQADQEMEEAKKQVEETSRRVNNPITCQPTREFCERVSTAYSWPGRLPTSEEVSHTTDPWFK